MTDAINHYRTYLNAAPKQNATGLPHNVWAMLSTLDRMMGMHAAQVESNWKSQVAQDERLKRVEKQLTKDEA